MDSLSAVPCICLQAVSNKYPGGGTSAVFGYTPAVGQTPPGPPVDLNATLLDASSIQLSWTSPSTTFPPDLYIVFVSLLDSSGNVASDVYRLPYGNGECTA